MPTSLLKISTPLIQQLFKNIPRNQNPTSFENKPLITEILSLVQETQIICIFSDRVKLGMPVRSISENDGIMTVETENRQVFKVCAYIHGDVIKWKHFQRYWPFVRGIELGDCIIELNWNWIEIHRLPVNSPHKGQWHGALMFSLICAWIHCWVNNGGSGDLRRYCAHRDVTVMRYHCFAILMEMQFMVLHLVCLICDWIVTVIYCD